MSDENHAPTGEPPVAPYAAERWLIGVVVLAAVVFAAQAGALLTYVLSMRDAPRTAVERRLAADEAAVQDRPQDIENWARVALSYASAERWSDAADAISRGRAIKSAAILDLTEADILRMKGDAAAIQAYDRAITSASAEYEQQKKALLKDKNVRVPPPSRLLAEALAGRALALHAAGRTREAVDQAMKALEADPSDAELHAALGDMLVSVGRKADAETQYREALRYVPDLKQALDGLRTLGAGVK
ncbi:MAG: BTAD domain-containing putative transcriptional regulator [Coriobacteriia bacterium]|nr:BTAD domain-containing putative transcriptional regulator [Coriobacteriia bacterium]